MHIQRGGRIRYDTHLLSNAMISVYRLKVDPSLLNEAHEAFTTTVQKDTPGPTFAQDFGVRKMEREVEILDMPIRGLIKAWETCVRTALSAKVSVEDEITTSITTNVSSTLHVSSRLRLLTPVIRSDRAFAQDVRL